MIEVLLVDDELPILELTQFFLEEDGGFKVETAVSAKAALDKMAHHPYDAVVSDYQMEDLDGLDFLKIIRAQGNSIPFILFTGKGREDVAIEALNNGADFYIQKGGDPRSQFTELKHVIVQSVQQRRAEEELRRSEERYRLFFETTGTAVTVTDENNLIVLVNNEAEKLSCYTKEELEGKKKWTEFVAREDLERLAEYYRTRAADSKTAPSQYEFRYVDKLGRVKPVLATVAMIPGTGKHLVSIIDLSGLKRTEEALRESERELKNALEKRKELEAIVERSNAVVFLWRMIEGWPVDFVSGNVTQFGYVPDDLLSGRVTYSKLIHPDDFERVRNELESYRQQGVTEFGQEYRIVAKSGEIRWVDDRTVVRHVANGAVTHHEGIVIDITERKKAEMRTLEATSKLQAVLSVFPDLLFMFNSDGTILDYSAGRASDLYLPPEEFLGKHVQNVLPPDVGKLAEARIREAFERRSVSALEYSLPTKDGIQNFEARLVPIFENQILGIVRNMTEHKRTEEALRQANEKLNLLGNVTRHDVLNQLAVLVGWLGLSADAAKDKKVLEYLNRMKLASETMRTQLEFTADYQKMGVKGPEWMAAKKALLEGVSGLDIGEVPFEHHLDGLEVYADPMLEKVFHNLFDNSLRHGGKVSRIACHFKKSEEGVVLIYEDNGVGVPENEKERVFQPGLGNHTGYGLFMARVILGITGLTIEENGVPGKGAKFEIHVPNGKYRLTAE